MKDAGILLINLLNSLSLRFKYSIDFFAKFDTLQ